MRSDLAAQRFHLLHILVGPFQFAQAFQLLPLVDFQAESVLDHLSALADRRRKDTVGFPLGDDMMPGRSDMRAGQ